MAVIDKITRYQGAKGLTQIYEATSALKLVGREDDDLHICYAALTGAMTINCTFTSIQQFTKVYFHFTADTTSRTVTFGTGFINMTSGGMTGATVIIPLSSNGT